MKRKVQLVALLVILSQLTLYSQQKGTVILENVAAPSLANSVLGEPTSQPVAIYLPPSYYNEPGKKYPVVYYLPGYGDIIDTYLKGWLNGYYFESSMNSNITQGRLREVIMVIINSANLLDGCFYNNSPVIGNWEDFIVKDVVNHMDTKYRTIPSAGSRALTGMSMGGYGALHFSMRHPSVFSIGLGQCAGLATPTGMMETSLFDDVNVIKRVISIRKKLSSLPRAEAHQRYLDTVKYYRTRDWVTVFSFAYGSAFAPDTSLNAPYFKYPFSLDSNNNLVKDTAVFKIYENGFGNLKAKVELYRDSLLKLRGYAIDYGTEDYFKWIPKGSVYFDSLLTAENIPHRLWKNNGGHGDLHKARTENFELPYCDSLLTFDTVRLSSKTLIEKITFSAQASVPTIDTAQKKVYVTLKSGIKLNSIRPVIYLSPGARVSPALSAYLDFSSGSVTYTVTSENGKNTIWTVHINGVSAIENVSQQIQKLKIFPNPVNDHFLLSLENDIIYKLEITDTFGRIVVQKEVNNQSALIEKNNIASGTYFIKAYTAKGIFVEKLTFR